MDIAIIGAGNVGKALATSSVRAGHHVTISASGQGSAARAAEATGADAAATNREAVEGADVVVLAVWYASVDDVLAELGPDALDGKVVIDTTNPVKADLSGLLFDGTSAAERLQAKLPGASVVKAFNTIFASRQADPFVDGTPVDALYAGDDEDAKMTVARYAASLGFRPIDVGNLDMARGLESFALLNMQIQVHTNGSWQGGWKLLEPKAA